MGCGVTRPPMGGSRGALWCTAQVHALGALIESCSHHACLAACAVEGHADRLARARVSERAVRASGRAPLLRILLAFAFAFVFALLWLLLLVLLLVQLLVRPWKLTLRASLLLLVLRRSMRTSR